VADLKLLSTVGITLIAWIVPAMAQTGSIRGVVVDPLPALVPNVSVELVSGSSKFTTKTNERGEFLFDAVPPSTYELHASIVGFYTATVRSLTLRAGEERRLPAIPLTVASSGCYRPSAVLELISDNRLPEVRGVVLAGSARRPLVGYSLILHNDLGKTPDVTLITDERGEFHVSEVSSGSYRLHSNGGVLERFDASAGWDVVLEPLWVGRCPDGGCEQQFPPPEVVVIVCE